MSLVRRAALALALLLGLTACSAKPDLPMEAVVDGYTIVLGKTTAADLTALGYELSLAGRQDVARDGDKYIYFMYLLSKGAGRSFRVNVYTPYYGGANINKEAAEAAESGVVYSVSLSRSEAEKMSVSYNGMDLRDITFDAAREWGARRDQDASEAVWRLTAARGSLSFSAENTFSEEMHTLQVTMNSRVFADMQK